MTTASSADLPTTMTAEPLRHPSTVSVVSTTAKIGHRMSKIVASAVPVAAALTLASALPASAAPVPPQNWLTSISGASTLESSEQSWQMHFANSDVTATETLHRNDEPCRAGSPTNAAQAAAETPLTDGDPNGNQYVEPDPPTDSISIASCTANASTWVATVTFSRPVLNPIIHVKNLDNSSLMVMPNTISGETATLTTVSKNSVLRVSGNSLLPNLSYPPVNGCRTDSGGANGGCGSFQMNGEISSFQLESMSPPLADAQGGDNWSWSLSIPAVPQHDIPLINPAIAGGAAVALSASGALFLHRRRHGVATSL